MTTHKDSEGAPWPGPADTDLDRVLRAADDELLRHIHAYGRPNAALLSIMSASEQEETSPLPPQPPAAPTRSPAAENAIALIESRRLARDLAAKAAKASDYAMKCQLLLAHGEEAESAEGRFVSGPEGRFLTGPGKPLYRSLCDLKDSEASVAAKYEECQAAAARAEAMTMDRWNHHRGGHLSWLLRLVILLAALAEGVVAFMCMEVLVPSLLLAGGLAALAALVGVGMACVLANRRLNRLPVPVAARIIEGLFVAVLTALRYVSLQLSGAGMAAAGGAALAALITALCLLGIEEVLVGTETFGVFVSRRRTAYRRRRAARAAARLSRQRARVTAAAVTLRGRFLDFLRREEFAPDEAERRAFALMRVLGEGGEEDGWSATCRGLLTALATKLNESLKLAQSIPGAPATWGRLLEPLCKTAADRLTHLSETLTTRPLSILDLRNIELGLTKLITEIDRFVADEVDVSGLDLSRANLPDVDLLKGVIWTPDTTWPPGLAETVRAQSAMVADGVYQVIGGAERDPDLVTAR